MTSEFNFKTVMISCCTEKYIVTNAECGTNAVCIKGELKKYAKIIKINKIDLFIIKNSFF